jgi:hypothetical protein
MVRTNAGREGRRARGFSLHPADIVWQNSFQGDSFKSGSPLPLFCFYLEELCGVLAKASAFSLNSELSV